MKDTKNIYEPMEAILISSVVDNREKFYLLLDGLLKMEKYIEERQEEQQNE